MKKFKGLLLVALGLIPSTCFGAAEIQAVRAKTAAKIDGQLNDACWQTAQPITEFTKYRTKHPSDSKTFGYLAYDDSYIYIAMNCLDPDPGSIKASISGRHDERVLDDDCVEIMVDPGRTQERYFQFVVGAGGGTFDVARTRAGAGEDDDWQGSWESAAAVNDDGWSVELAIPYGALQIAVDSGSTWGMNFCRSGGKPRQMMATAKNGIFNDAAGFIVARGIEAQFAKFRFEVGAGETRFVLQEGKPFMMVALPVVNRTGEAVRVMITHQSASDWRDQRPHSHQVMLQPGASVPLGLEPQRLQEMTIGKSDRYFILDAPAVERVTVSDASSGEILCKVNANLPLMCSAVHVQAKQLRPCLVLAVQQNLADALLETCLLRVNVSKKGSLQSLLSKEFPQLSEKRLEVDFGTKLPPGVYQAQATLVDKSGQAVAESVRPVIVQPPEVKVLNNFVTQLVDVEGRKARGGGEFIFINPRNGWIFIRSTSGPAEVVTRLVLNDAVTKKDVVVHQPGPGSTLETKRFLPLGQYSIQVGSGHLSHLVVRAIPEAICRGGGGPAISGFIRHDWEFMKKYMLSNVTTLRVPLGHELEWKKSGGRALASGLVPHEKSDKASLAQKAYKDWTANPSFSEPALDGFMVDEFVSVTAEQSKGWSEAIRRFSAEPRYRDKSFYPFVTRIYGSDAGRLLMNVLLGSGRYAYSWECYLQDQPTLAETKAYLQKELIDGGVGWTEGIEGGIEGMIMCFGTFSIFPESCNTNPATNFKVFQDMEWNIVANDPLYKGIRGIHPYMVKYSEPEINRWVSKLIRHYCIEGRTERLSDDSYELTHIQHPDYPDPQKGWTIIEAEPGAVAVDRLANYSRILLGWGRRSELDSFLRMRRSPQGPNSFSQKIKDLEPGRLYSLKMAVADYGDMANGVSRRLESTFSVRLDNVELLSDQCFDGHFRGNPALKFKTSDLPQLICAWRVFRAQGPTAKLTVSDWVGENGPGGPIGQELMFNFIEIQPYLDE